MHLLLIGYMFLFIDRPFEVWPVLGDYHLERVYFLGMIGYWAVVAEKRFIASSLHLGFLIFAGALLVCWGLSSWPSQGQATIENWLKILAFYVLIVTSVPDERSLKRLVAGFVGAVFLYMLHSMREFLGGRHTYRMGIVRMLGVDATLGDPNSFGATILFSLPFLIALRKTATGFAFKLFSVGYLGLAFACIGLTGSRSAFLGLSVWVAIEVFQSRYRWASLAGAVVLSPVLFLMLPDSLQMRFESIIFPEVGPQSARDSSEGRWQGLYQGFELFAQSPLSGCGPGAWLPATHSKIESHNLYGQMLGETGLLGTSAFLLVLGLLYRQLQAIRLASQEGVIAADGFLAKLSRATTIGLFLLLLEGNFGHNLYRYNWLWFGAFLVVARHCIGSQSSVMDMVPNNFPDFCSSKPKVSLGLRT